MKLHTDKNAFVQLLNNVNSRTGIRFDILEKDYYVTLILKELADKQDTIPAYFKGGTALYKALGSIRRFSEDIDLTVEIRDCNNSQAKKRLESVSKKYTVLNRTQNHSLETDKRGSITTIYDYIPATDVDEKDSLQRFKCVKVEATSFTVSEPYETSEIAPVIYELATEQERRILESMYDVKPFGIKTIKIERIFADKIFAAEFYYTRNDLFDTAKHIYDLTVMMVQPRIIEMLNTPDLFAQMIAFKRTEEKERIGSDLSNKKFSDFVLFKELDDSSLVEAFENMQNIYVFNENDKVKYDDVMASLNDLTVSLFQQDFYSGQDEEQTFDITMG